MEELRNSECFQTQSVCILWSDKPLRTGYETDKNCSSGWVSPGTCSLNGKEMDSRVQQRWLIPNPHTACSAEMDFCQGNFGMTTRMIQQMSELWSGGKTKFKARDRGTQNAPGTWSRCELKEISNRLYPQLKCITSTYWMPGPLKIIILLGDIPSSKQKELNGNFTVFKCHLFLSCTVYQRRSE